MGERILRDFDNELEKLLHETQGDVASVKSFLIKALPLVSGFFLAAYMYRQDADPFWLMVSLLLLVVTVGYLILSIMHDVVLALHKGKTHRDVSAKVWHRMIISMEKVADNDLLALFFVIIIPVAILLLLKVGDSYLRDQVVLRWLQSFVCLIYLTYLAIVVFVQAHRALLLVMKTRNVQMRQIEERMAIMRKNDAIASRTHDTVSSGLSFIAFTAQKNIEDGAAPQRDWNDVNEAAMNTLDNVHKVIRLLAAGPVPQTDDLSKSSSPDGWHMFVDACALGDVRLRKLGFGGTSKVAAGTACVSADVTARISGLITEIYTNISRYADKNVPYLLTIEEKNDEVIITQANGIANLTVDNSEDRGSRGSGNGLRMHAQWIDSIGGVLNTSKEDGEWILYASIPVSRE